MKILIDESLPHALLHLLSEYDTYTVQYMGWGGMKNGALLKLAEEQFDIFLTADKNLRYQQNLAGRAISIVVFPSNRLDLVEASIEALRQSLLTIQPSQVVEL